MTMDDDVLQMMMMMEGDVVVVVGRQPPLALIDYLPFHQHHCRHYISTHSNIRLKSNSKCLVDCSWMLHCFATHPQTRRSLKLS